ncbi:MAG TPA: PilX N-terminal domain-containing pilus assembly protein, partial [Candidatus Angelobacter sp.]|nr:PilX N-terminal domain-containing pilus assembly protein [Candidatus Angelobacter sp.]
MNKKVKPHLRQQRGIAMIVALLSLVLLAAIGMALMFMADTENSVNNNYRDSQKAYFAARAGAEQARILLASDANLKAAALALAMPSSAANTGIIYLKNPTNGETIDPTANPYLDDQLCWEKYTGMTLTAGTGPCGSNGQNGQLMTNSLAYTTRLMATSPGVVGSDALPFKWVRIANKQNLMGGLNQKVNSGATNAQQVCWDGGVETVIPLLQTCAAQNPNAMPVWEVTSLAVTPPLGQNPGSRRMVQMEVAFNPALVPPAPISTMAPVNLQGSFILNAYDNCSCTCTTSGSGAHQVTTCGAGQPNCVSSAHAVYTQNTVSVTGGAGTTLTSFGSDPTAAASVQNVNP